MTKEGVKKTEYFSVRPTVRGGVNHYGQPDLSDFGRFGGMTYMC